MPCISPGPPIVLKVPPETKSLAAPAHWLKGHLLLWRYLLGRRASAAPMPGLCSQTAGLRQRVFSNRQNLLAIRVEREGKNERDKDAKGTNK